MKLDIVIPTLKRKDKLERTLASIRCAITNSGSHVDAHIKVFYSDKEEYLNISDESGWPWVKNFLLPEKEFRITDFWNDRLKESTADVFCYLTDDISLDKFCLANMEPAINGMGFDGVLGFRIENITEREQPCLASFGVIGLKYADRFIDRKVFCPDYCSLFADMEFQRQAEALGKFKFVPECSLVHYHPNYMLAGNDSTHKHYRRNDSMDRKTFELRSKRNLIWGLNPELINNQEKVNA